jgi:NAD(P) transhydrogenase subunit alpha
MIESMDDGSVVVDLSAPTGGNCEPTVASETIEHDGVTIHGPTDLASQVSHTASQQYANNVVNFLDNLLEDGELDVDLDDEIVDSTLLTHEGTIRNPHEEDDQSGDEGGDGDGDAAEDGGPTDAEEVSDA